jgi:hypothetical protein
VNASTPSRTRTSGAGAMSDWPQGRSRHRLSRTTPAEDDPAQAAHQADAKVRGVIYKTLPPVSKNPPRSPATDGALTAPRRSLRMYAFRKRSCSGVGRAMRRRGPGVGQRPRRWRCPPRMDARSRKCARLSRAGGRTQADPCQPSGIAQQPCSNEFKSQGHPREEWPRERMHGVSPRQSFRDLYGLQLS